MDFLNKHVSEFVKSPEEERPFSNQELKELVSYIDLTTLNYEDTEESIENLCSKASSPAGDVASICVYPKFVSLVGKLVPHKIPITSVANFPSGQEKLETTLDEIKFGLKSGANEIDVVFPYTEYLKGHNNKAVEYIKECKQVCGESIMKVILEISEFDNLEKIYALSQELINSGADFIKTSTGKSMHGATLEGASVMLLAIKSSEKNVGFKASGGIKKIDQALAYVELAKKIMGDKWVTPKHFRIGASNLLDHILSAFHSNS